MCKLPHSRRCAGTALHIDLGPTSPPSTYKKFPSADTKAGGEERLTSRSASACSLVFGAQKQRGFFVLTTQIGGIKRNAFILKLPNRGNKKKRLYFKTPKSGE
jgi:hypothetical protein